ncbi:MAG: ComF family protein [Acidobacteria bacterium]|nr:ComF family protein [Acidobacteriota bacterium]
MFLDHPSLLHGTALCGYCRHGVFGFERARSFGAYDGALREILQQYKYQGYRPLARPLGDRLAQTFKRLHDGPLDLILPVPLHRRRERERGFNQAGLLAERVGKLSGIRLGGKDCVRARDTPPQAGLRAAERRKNVKGAFAVPHPERVRGRRILLVDDVLTTGATADACARALMAAGAKGVWVLTLARARAASLDVL